MKSTIASIACGVACVLFLYSCKKGGDNAPDTPPVQPSTEKVLVHLTTGGEFTTSISDLPGGRQIAGNDNAGAKTIRDSTYYWVAVLDHDTLYAAGIYYDLDSVQFLLNKTSTYKIRMAVIQKGTGYGFWVGTYNTYPPNSWADKPNAYGPFYGPVSGHTLYAYQTHPFPFTNQFGGDIFAWISPTTAKGEGLFGEVTLFYGDTTITSIDTSHPYISIPFKRLSCGYKMDCPELTQGKLNVYYEWDTQYWLPVTYKEFTPANIHDLTILSNSDFAIADSVSSNYSNVIYARITYTDVAGTVTNLGRKKIPIPKRNRLITIKVNLPTPSGGTKDDNSMNIQITETSYLPGTTIRF